MPPRRYTDDQLRQAVASAGTMREVLTMLGLVPRGANYETVRQRARILNLDLTRLHRRTLLTCPDEAIADAVRSSRSFAQVLRALGLKPGGNQARLKARVEALGLDTSHFVGQGWRRGAVTAVVPRRPLAELLIDGRLVSTNGLRTRLIRDGLKERRCEECRLAAWNGRPIPLELDHVNGRRMDNRLENLRILCPNCHAQTSTYRGRNIGSLGALS